MFSSRNVAAATSVLLRVLVPFFLRIFPGSAVPPIIVALFAIYVPAFLQGLRLPTKFILIEDTLDITIKEPTVIPGPGEDAAESDDDDDDDDGDDDVQDVQDEAARDAPFETDPLLPQDEVIVTEAQETVTVLDKSPSPLAVLLAGTPSPQNLLLSLVSFAVNAALVLAAGDFIYRAHYAYPSDDLSFVRLGYVSPTEANFLIREPDQSRMPVSIQLHIKDPLAVDNPLWQTVGGINWTGNDSDFTAALTVPLRHAEQRVYEWQTSNGHSGQFSAPPRPGAVSALAGHDGKFTFLSTSCILPYFPYNPLDHPLAIPGMRHLARRLPELGAQFMLFLGDFIYVDVPWRLGSMAVDYRRKYRQAYASPEWQSVGQNLSWIHVLDDHEIANDWSANSTGVYAAAMEPYVHYHAQVNPPPPKRVASRGVTQPQARFFEFTQGPATFFLADTRSFRSPNALPAHGYDKTMLGAEQLDELLYWLARPEPRGVKWKVLASSVPFTKNWPVNNGDTWGGFLDERQVVLEAMWDAGARGYGIVILSGDRHEFAATKFPPPEGGRWPQTAVPHEFSASPLNQFASPFPTYKQVDEQDVPLKYIHAGSSKFGALTMDLVQDGRLSTLRYTLYVNGEEAWSTDVLTPETPEEELAAAPGAKKGLLGFLGL
jgi:alkaline phosphatase D